MTNLFGLGALNAADAKAIMDNYFRYTGYNGQPRPEYTPLTPDNTRLTDQQYATKYGLQYGTPSGSATNNTNNNGNINQSTGNAAIDKGLGIIPEGSDGPSDFSRDPYSNPTGTKQYADARYAPMGINALSVALNALNPFSGLVNGIGAFASSQLNGTKFGDEYSKMSNLAALKDQLSWANKGYAPSLFGDNTALARSAMANAAGIKFDGTPDLSQYGGLGYNEAPAVNINADMNTNYSNQGYNPGDYSGNNNTPNDIGQVGSGGPGTYGGGTGNPADRANDNGGPSAGPSSGNATNSDYGGGTGNPADRGYDGGHDGPSGGGSGAGNAGSASDGGGPDRGDNSDSGW